jgi:hypothetical protein
MTGQENGSGKPPESEQSGAVAPATRREAVADGSMTLGQAGQRDTDRIERLLSANDLPQEGVRTNPWSFFFATVGTELVGVGGIERHGQHGLVRSVVVPESHRGQGSSACTC